MLQNILKLDGVKKLSRNVQSAVSGGVGPHENCWEDPICGCGPQDGSHILSAC